MYKKIINNSGCKVINSAGCFVTSFLEKISRFIKIISLVVKDYSKQNILISDYSKQKIITKDYSKQSIKVR